MKSLHQSAILARILGELMHSRYTDYWIHSLYSNSKTELVLELKKSKQELKYIVFNFAADNLLILLPEHIRKRSRLAQDHFNIQNEAQISSIENVENERIIQINLSNSSKMFICLFGRRSDVLLKTEGDIQSFRNSKNAINLIENLSPNPINFNMKDWDLFWESNRFLPQGKISGTYSPQNAQHYIDGLKNAGLVRSENRLSLSPKSLGKIEQLIEIHEFNLNFLKRFTQERRAKEEESRRIKHLKNINQRLAAAKNKLMGLEKSNQFMQWGDVIISNLSQIDPTLKVQQLTDWTTQELIEVPLNTDKSPVENANRYYQKAKNAHKEISFLKAKIDVLEKEIQNPIVPGQKAIKEKQTASPYYSFEFEGFEIRVGKSATANDELIKFHSHKNDLWLHAKDVPGSHVIVRMANNQKLSNALLEYAASLAAKYSKSKGQTLAAVSYTPRKYVRKNKKMLPGQVRLEKEETILIKPAD